MADRSALVAGKGVPMTSEEILEAEVVSYRDHLQHRFEFFRSRCESPIEELFLAALIAQIRDYREETLNPLEIFGGDWSYGQSRAPWDGIGVHLQARVGDYRADFLFDDLQKGDRKFVAVELDGHDFHEKTKEQAQRDKRRDRYFVGRGIRVLRFTGSEVFRDPASVVEEVLDHCWYAERSGR